MLSFNQYQTEYDNTLFEEAMNLLYEKLITFKGGAKYGQIVFLSGGAGSGKGFASSTFMDSNLFKIRDVDSWKKSFIAIAELKNKYPEIRGLNLREKKDVAAMHAFVKKMGIKNKTLDLLLTDVKADRLPNIMFDITGKEMADFDEVVPRLIEVGYASADLHLVWILANWKASFVANLRRSRVVPADIFLGTHRGAAQTMVRLLEQQKMPRGMNGAFHVVMNNRDNTVYFEPGETYKGRTVPATDSKGKKIEIVKSFYYITVKDAGKSFRPESAWKKELFDQIVANVPGGESVLNQAVADLSESYNNS